MCIYLRESQGVFVTFKVVVQPKFYKMSLLVDLMYNLPFKNIYSEIKLVNISIFELKITIDSFTECKVLEKQVNTY